MKLLITLSTLAGIWKTEQTCFPQTKLSSDNSASSFVIKRKPTCQNRVSVCWQWYEASGCVNAEDVLVFRRGCDVAVSEMCFLKINLSVVVNCELSPQAMEWQNDNNKKEHGWNDLGRKLEFCSKIMKFLEKNQNRLAFKHVLFKVFQLHENIEDFLLLHKIFVFSKKNVGGMS